MPQELYVKQGGVWRLIAQPYVYDVALPGWRQLTEAYVKQAGVWRQFFQGTLIVNHVISSNINNFNLRQVLINTYGWNQSSVVLVTVTINAGVLVGSTSTATPAFLCDNGTPYPAGSTISIINNGTIGGAGGNGGKGGDFNVSNEQNGLPGGTALKTTQPITLTNNGTIGGGCGGGGGGDSTASANGGGGGGGDGIGQGGLGGAAGSGAGGNGPGFAWNDATNPGKGGGTGARRGANGGGQGATTVLGDDGDRPNNGNAREGLRGNFAEGYDKITWNTRGTLQGTQTPYKKMSEIIAGAPWAAGTAKLMWDWADPAYYNGGGGATIADQATPAITFNFVSSLWESNLDYSYYGLDDTSTFLDYAAGTLTAFSTVLRNNSKLTFIFIGGFNSVIGTGPSGSPQTLIDLIGSTFSIATGSGGRASLLLKDDTGVPSIRFNMGAVTIVSATNLLSPGGAVIIAHIDEAANTVTFVHSDHPTAEIVSATISGIAAETVTDIALGRNYSNSAPMDGQMFAGAVLIGASPTPTDLENLFQTIIKDKYGTSGSSFDI